MSLTLGMALRQAIACLEQHAVAEPRAAAEVLLADLLQLSRPGLYIEATQSLSPDQQVAYHERVRRCSAGEPVQYITGTQEFWSLPFTVSPAVLIPRPESELLVEQGVRLGQRWAKTQRSARLYLLDVGTGSGCLAISLAHTLPQAQVLALDNSWPALQVARQNARRLGVAGRVHCVGSDLTAALQPARRCFAVCVANLPYVSSDEWRHLPRHIQAYEPVGALCGGADGLELIRRLIAASPAYLAAGGTLLLEVGWQQAASVVAILQQHGGFSATGVYHDFAGIERVVWGQVL
ncbi:MAG: peptide chain release factor N(5)-glutamine methyltransferase [Candidatus Tectimicrobiota bacterium]